ncbi:MAG: hypothetical protein ABIJ45_00160 [Candidatus Zixiibacteriota bacterium]
MNRERLNLIIFIVILAVYLVGQGLIGTYHPVEKEFYFDKPADADFLYYGAIINQVMNDFPPNNPAFGGENLTQPFLQYYPGAILAQLFYPYNAIRILNVIYLILFAYLLRRYFPTTYGFGLMAIFAASAPLVNLNALGVDFIARGFTHVPFFILLTITLFSKDLKWRLGSIFVASMINGYMMLMVLPCLGIFWLIERKRMNLYIVISAIAGMLLASVYISTGAVDKPFYFIFAESFKFAPKEIIMHAIPFIILSLFYRNTRGIIFLAAAVIFGSLIHYNPFFPIFLVYYAGALIVLERDSSFGFAPNFRYLILSIIFLAFIYESYDKYNPQKGGYYPHYDGRVQSSIEWIKQNTEPNDVFIAMTTEDNELAFLMESRPVYLGYAGHVAHLGYNWKERHDNMVRLYNMGMPIKNVNYLYYGPIERRYFPGAQIPFEIAHRDNYVTIYKLQ